MMFGIPERLWRPARHKRRSDRNDGPDYADDSQADGRTPKILRRENAAIKR